MRQDSRHPGTNPLPFDESRMADSNTFDVGDRVPVSRFQHAHLQSQFSSSLSLRWQNQGVDQENTNQGNNQAAQTAEMLCIVCFGPTLFRSLEGPDGLRYF